MESKKILYGDDARRSLFKGMEILAEAVALTIGPRGRNVVIDNEFGLIVDHLSNYFLFFPKMVQLTQNKVLKNI
jgi:hypothetical protein